MIGWLIFLCAFSLSVEIIPKCEASTDISMPRFTLNLDLPPRERWKEIVSYYPLDSFPKFITLVRNAHFVPDAALKVGENVGEHFDQAFLEPYRSEMLGIMDLINMTKAEMVQTQTLYDFFMYFCTSVVMQGEDGNIYHGRNMDFYGTIMTYSDALRNMTLTVDFQRDGKTVYTGTTFLGFVGLLTGIRYDAFSLSTDERDYDVPELYELSDILMNQRPSPIGFIMRSVLENATDFEEAIEILSSEFLITPTYLIVAGVNKDEGAVITRRRNETLDVWRLDSSVGRWYVFDANNDNWLTGYGSPRYNTLIFMLNNTDPADAGLEAIGDMLSIAPIYRRNTLYTALMSPTLNHYEVSIRFSERVDFSNNDMFSSWNFWKDVHAGVYPYPTERI